MSLDHLIRTYSTTAPNSVRHLMVLPINHYFNVYKRQGNNAKIIFSDASADLSIKPYKDKQYKGLYSMEVAIYHLGKPFVTMCASYIAGDEHAGLTAYKKEA